MDIEIFLLILLLLLPHTFQIFHSTLKTKMRLQRQYRKFIVHLIDIYLRLRHCHRYQYHHQLLPYHNNLLTHQIYTPIQFRLFLKNQALLQIDTYHHHNPCFSSSSSSNSLIIYPILRCLTPSSKI